MPLDNFLPLKFFLRKKKIIETTEIPSPTLSSTLFSSPTPFPTENPTPVPSQTEEPTPTTYATENPTSTPSNTPFPSATPTPTTYVDDLYLEPKEIREIPLEPFMKVGQKVIRRNVGNSRRRNNR